MKRELQLTADNSHTLFVAELPAAYHSKHGALQESLHVFINAGLNYVLSRKDLSTHQPINVFEVGFGTGLNALLSLKEAIHQKRKINYYAIELFPLLPHEWGQLNYTAFPEYDFLNEYFFQMHTCSWEKDVYIHPLFTLHKTHQSLESFSTNHQINFSNQLFHLVYFDAFAPVVQPELWTKAMFEKMFSILQHNGALVTYCSKGDVRRAMLAAGFKVEKLPGALGKREMLRAVKRD